MRGAVAATDTIADRNDPSIRRRASSTLARGDRADVDGGQAAGATVARATDQCADRAATRRLEIPGNGDLRQAALSSGFVGDPIRLGIDELQLHLPLADVSIGGLAQSDRGIQHGHGQNHPVQERKWRQNNARRSNAAGCLTRQAFFRSVSFVDRLLRRRAKPGNRRCQDLVSLAVGLGLSLRLFGPYCAIAGRPCAAGRRLLGETL
jgi:hypothetical protein